MAIKVCLFLSLAVVVFLSQSTRAFPRDGGLEVIEDVHGSDVVTPKSKLDEPKVSSTETLQHIAAHRLVCTNDSDEPTEDTTCQEHCLPKGYSYGLCVSATCTCV